MESLWYKQAYDRKSYMSPLGAAALSSVFESFKSVNTRGNCIAMTG